MTGLVLIIGGGPAGLAAAAEAAKRGERSIIVESGDVLGGRPELLSCKGSPDCASCDACSPWMVKREASSSLLVRKMLRSRIVACTRTGSGFKVAIETREVGGTSVMEQDVGSIVIATGHEPYRPVKDGRFHMESCRDVMSAAAAEAILRRSGRLVVPSTGKAPRSMAFVQCVGSRTSRSGGEHCSRACCKYALKLARSLRSEIPGLEVTFLYMDWRPSYGGADDLRDFAQEEGVKVIRSRPAEIVPGPRPALRFADQDDRPAEQEFDMIVLSVGMMPRDDAADLASVLGVKLRQSGFFMPDNEGIFAAGACAGPKDIRESIEDGTAAGARAACWKGAVP